MPLATSEHYERYVPRALLRFASSERPSQDVTGTPVLLLPVGGSTSVQARLGQPCLVRCVGHVASVTASASLCM